MKAVFPLFAALTFFLCAMVVAQTREPASQPASAPATQPIDFAGQRLTPIQTADELLQQDKTIEAFNLLVTNPGGENKALQLAATDEETFAPLIADLLAKTHDTATLARLNLLAADAKIRSGDKAKAAITLRRAAKELADSDVYLVDVQTHYALQDRPFGAGCGSQGDNALVKRFSALGCDDDVAAEFARVWAIYEKSRSTTAPVFLNHRISDDPQRRQFVMDYAHYSKEHNRPDLALKLLSDELARTELDKDGGVFWGFGGFAPPTDWEMGAEEFLRLAYGEFQTADRTDDLIASVQKQIDAGQNRARRILARIRQLQSRPADALALELAYIERGKFNTLSTLLRRAQIEEQYKKPAEAIADYEKAIALSQGELDLPSGAIEFEADLDSVPMRRDSKGDWTLPADVQMRQTRAWIEIRLIPLYTATGQAQKALDASLVEMDLRDPSQWHFRSQLKPVMDRFVAAGQLKKFSDWVHKKASSVSDPGEKADLFWTAGDSDAAVDAVVEIAKLPTSAGERDLQMQNWRDTFERAGLLEKLALKLAEAGVENLNAQVLRLGVDRAAGDVQWMPLLEKIIKKLKATRPGYAGLGLDCVPGNVSGGGHTPFFRSSCDVAYRLMRCYQRAGQVDKLEALGAEVARGSGFSAPPRSDFEGFFEDDASAAISLAILLADSPRAQQSLADALKDSPWSGQLAQLKRRSAATWPAAPGEPFGWANIPENVNALASIDNVLSIAADEQRIYVGHPWGVAVYTADGQPIKRVALGQAVSSLAACGGVAWAGTQRGLYRIDPVNWSVNWVPPVDNCDFPTVIAAGNVVWSFSEKGAAMIDTIANRIRTFNPETMYCHSAMRNPEIPPVVDGGFIYRFAARYNPMRRQWEHLDATALALFNDTLFGLQFEHPDDVHDEKRRLCIIDRSTGKSRPLSIIAYRNGMTLGDSSTSENFSLAGTLDGRPVFKSDFRFLKLDADNRHLRQVHVPSDSTTGRPAGLKVADPLHQQHSHWANLPGGRFVVGDGEDNYWLRGREAVDLARDRPITQELDVARRGVSILTDDGKPFLPPVASVISSQPYANCIVGDCGYAVSAEGNYVWLGTERGVSLLDNQGRVIENFERGNGFPASRITAILPLGGKVFFATRHDDSAGGLVVFDRAKRVFSLLVPSDGLASGAVLDLSAEGDKLKIGYGVDYNRGGQSSGYSRMPPTVFDPNTGAFSAAGSPTSTEDIRANASAGSMPLLGGEIFSRQSVGKKIYWLGSRGVLVTDAGQEVEPVSFPKWSVPVDQDVSEKLKE